MPEKVNFYFDLFEKRAVPDVYHELPKRFGGLYRTPTQLHRFKKGMLVINTIPAYFDVGKNNLLKAYGCIERSYRLGFAMDLSNSDSAEEYLRNQLGKKAYKNLRQDKQRLEREHRITFRRYCKDLDPATYDLLIATLESYIRGRFVGRTHKHASLQRWEHYRQNIYEQVQAGNASLFVLWEADKPISIAVGYHYGQILVAAINSFDTRFEPYSMGRLMFFWQLTWCFENSVRLLDLGWGAFDYKVRLSNAVYRLKTQVLYPKKNWLMKPPALLFSALMELKYYLVMLRDRNFQNPEVRYKDKWLTSLEYSGQEI